MLHACQIARAVVASVCPRPRVYIRKGAREVLASMAEGLTSMSVLWGGFAEDASNRANANQNEY